MTLFGLRVLTRIAALSCQRPSRLALFNVVLRKMRCRTTVAGSLTREALTRLSQPVEGNRRGVRLSECDYLIHTG